MSKPRPVAMVCETCGSDDVRADAHAAWDVELQMWEVAAIFDEILTQAAPDARLLARAARTPSLEKAQV